ncbi:MAG TPA: CheR family methyltransferase [Ramlibacter sp.]|nr:CheR family methyltransferase [Ramlibacter sp.]
MQLDKAADPSLAIGAELRAFDDPATLLNDADFVLVRRLIADYAGIKLSPQKRNMVYNRLLRRLRARGMGSFGAYLNLVQAEAAERQAFINALTTNLTAFFREPHHFELLGAVAKARAGQRLAPMRIWSTGCSTGEEAWSLAMVLREAGCAGTIHATDIDTDVLGAAAAGVYRDERVSGLDPQRLRQHFLRGTGSNEGWVSVRRELRTLVKFAQFNLQTTPWPAQDRFDAIFCRNVVIYFDKEFQKRLADRFAQLLLPGGLLIVGHSESFPAAHAQFRSCGRTAYQRVTT